MKTLEKIEEKVFTYTKNVLEWMPLHLIYENLNINCEKEVPQLAQQYISLNTCMGYKCSQNSKSVKKQDQSVIYVQ